MRWLRLYSEARTDAKLESLPDDEFRVWHRLLCFANDQPKRGTIAGFTPRLLAVEVARGDVALLERTLASLSDLRIIDTSEDGHHFTHWESRQYASDVLRENRPALSQWRLLREAVFLRDDYTCHYCGARGGRLECDHVIPVSRGGSNDLSNLVTACKPCNQSKRAKTPEEWLA